MDKLIALYHSGKDGTTSLRLCPEALADELVAKALPGDTLHMLTATFCDSGELVLLLVREQLAHGECVRV